MSDTVISVENLSKSYLLPPIGFIPGELLG